MQLALLRKKSLALLLTAALAVSLHGCLDCDKISSVSYDPKTDAFTVLRVYYNIRGSQLADVDSLLALYNNRDHILPIEPWAFLTETGVIRFGNEVREVNLAQGTMSPDTSKLPVDVTSIENKPGRFFTSPDGLVCYYHQMVVPGPVVDKLLAVAQEKGDESIAAAAQGEIDARKGGKPKATWAHQRKIFQGGIQGLPDAQREQPADGETYFLSALSDASLQILADAAKKGTVTLSRKAGVIHATGKLSPDDAGEIKATLAMARSELQNKIEGGGDATKQITSAIALLIDSLDVNIGADGSIDIAVDVNKVGPLLAKVQVAGLSAPDDDKKADYARITEGIAAAKTAIEPKTTATEILEKFKKGELPANPSEKPVRAGEGLSDKPNG